MGDSREIGTLFISGAARGLGQATSKYFLKRGYRVIEADVLFREFKDFRPAKELLQFPMDVSSREEVERTAEAIKGLGIRIDVLVNNAGFFDVYPLTEHDPKAMEEMMGTNFMGSLRLIRAFLQDLSQAGGRVIQISSESVKIPGAFQPYQISKIALEALSRSMRQELALKGVKLVIIRPGAMRTQLYGNLGEYKNPVDGSLYQDEFKVFVKTTTRFIQRIIEPEKAARLIYRAATARHPRLVYRINNNPLLTVMSMLPGRLMDRFVVNLLRKGG